MDKSVTLNQDLSTNMKKCTIFMKLFAINGPFFLHRSSCDQLSLYSEYHAGIFGSNNKIAMSN